MRLEQTFDIDAPPAAVWAVMQDLKAWPTWTASMRRVDLLDPPPVGPGTRVRVDQPRLPPARWDVTEWQADQGFTWVNRAPGIDVRARHAIVPRGSGSRVTLSIEYAGVLGRLFGWLTRGLTARYVAMEAAGLKARVEAR
jgi:hypothetical protein